MARKAVPKAVMTDVKKLIHELNNSDIHIDRAILFGSYAQGNETEYSDIDVALVSKDFSGIRFDDNQRIARKKMDINILIETHPYTPEDFEHSPFVRDEILAHGVDVI